MSTVKISPGNSKLGQIKSVSLPSLTTCRACGCNTRCYALKLERLRPAVRDAYQHNLNVLRSDPDTYWREVEAAIMLSRFFRFHVSGDIPDADYLDHMALIAARQIHCEILCFTKKFELVNAYLDRYSAFPPNLHLILSAWPGLPLSNPYDLPEAHVRFRDGTTTARSDAVPCPGNCTDCAVTDAGCWALRQGQQVIFDEH